jgi:response regulator RpfG family c-di-GMP phosphodiesterase
MNNRNSCILCVDDEPINLLLLEAMLVPQGYEVVLAADGAEALIKITERAIDLVLLDVMMPKLNGYDCCRMIKEDVRSRSIPVVMITGLQSKQDRVLSIEAGAEDFISKPIEKAEVLARIKMLLRIRELHNRLQHAYANINELIYFGEEMVKSFDPLNFDLLAKIDTIIGQILRCSVEDDDKPAMVLSGLTDEGSGRQWFLHEATDGTQTRTRLDFSVKHCLLSGAGESRTSFFNGAQIEASEVGALIKLVESTSGKIRNVVSYHSNEICLHALNYDREVTAYDAAVLNSIVMQSLFLKSLADQVRETDDAFSYTVHALARAAEVNDEDTGNHILRVGEFCGVIAEYLGMSSKFVSIIKLQSLMHDVGKIHIPAAILAKPGKLTDEEFAAIKEHPLYGAKILGDHIRLGMAREIALTHHERWDGGGYPHRLKGEQIPITGRIMHLADIYDALRSKRVYKPAFDHETAFGIITEGDGRTMPSHFDPRLLQAFKAMHQQFATIFERFND